MTEQNDVMTAAELGTDESTARGIMRYYGIDSHDELVKYIRHLGVGHSD
jgi:hypothetical protein